MKPLKLILTYLVIGSFFIALPGVRAESVDDRFTQISPKHSPGSGEFVHGQGYGKILMRVMLFGAVPQQGVHYVPEGTDLLFGLIYAGGSDDKAKLNGITIRRRGIQELMEVDLQDLIEEGQSIPKLADGDVVNVPYNWKKDYQEFTFLTGVFTSVTALVLAIAALGKN
jgi:hypothetical protein